MSIPTSATASAPAEAEHNPSPEQVIRCRTAAGHIEDQSSFEDVNELIREVRCMESRSVSVFPTVILHVTPGSLANDVDTLTGAKHATHFYDFCRHNKAADLRIAPMMTHTETWVPKSSRHIADNDTLHCWLLLLLHMPGGQPGNRLLFWDSNWATTSRIMADEQRKRRLAGKGYRPRYWSLTTRWEPAGGFEEANPPPLELGLPDTDDPTPEVVAIANTEDADTASPQAGGRYMRRWTIAQKIPSNGGLVGVQDRILRLVRPKRGDSPADRLTVREVWIGGSGNTDVGICASLMANKLVDLVERPLRPALTARDLQTAGWEPLWKRGGRKAK